MACTLAEMMLHRKKYDNPLHEWVQSYEKETTCCSRATIPTFVCARAARMPKIHTNKSKKRNESRQCCLCSRCMERLCSRKKVRRSPAVCASVRSGNHFIGYVRRDTTTQRFSPVEKFSTFFATRSCRICLFCLTCFSLSKITEWV